LQHGGASADSKIIKDLEATIAGLKKELQKARNELKKANDELGVQVQARADLESLVAATKLAVNQMETTVLDVLSGVKDALKKVCFVQYWCCIIISWHLCSFCLQE